MGKGLIQWLVCDVVVPLTLLFVFAAGVISFILGDGCCNG